MPRVVHVHTTNEWDAKMNESKSFGGKAIAPHYEALSDQPSYAHVTFLHVDVDELQEIAQGAGVRAMPTFQTYFNGEKVGEVVGADKAAITKLIDSVANRASSAGGQKVGGSTTADTSSGSETAEERRARMAAAAEARFAAQNAK